ncbi:MAG: hypothetical protein IJR58_04255 [Lachnospiraceae bacterium]|nr:hypothetical protein [Lachnospiraceae bacterium]
MKRFWSEIKRIRSNLLLLVVAALLFGGFLLPAEPLSAQSFTDRAAGVSATASVIRSVQQMRVRAAITSDEHKSSESVVRESGRVIAVKRSSVPAFTTAIFLPSVVCLTGIRKAHLPRLALPANRAVIIQYIHEQDGLK